VAPLTPSELREKIAESKKPRKAKAKRQPATLADLAYGSLLAFDQSLTNTGLAYIQHDPAGISVLTEMYQQVVDDAGHLGSLAKFRMLYDGLSRTHWAKEHHQVVYEQPVVQGHRTESILMGAGAVTLIWRSAQPISNQHAKSVIVANHMATKAQVGAAVNALVPHHLGPWNEHTRDAVLLGLAYLYDAKQGEAA
jgi:Holliday junction resolvasome RuvABC endonuclease subunit